MLKRLPIFVLLFCYASGRGGQKDTSLSFTSMGYDKPGLFIFQVRQMGSSNIVSRTDTLGLFCSEVLFPLNEGQKYCQWQLMTIGSDQKYTIIADQGHNVYEGIKTCDSELFMHPARSIYRIFQFCPYPYFKNKPIGSIWNWSFDIGAHWGMKGLYPIDTVDNFQIDYTAKDTVTVNTKFGQLFCHNIVAVSRSRFGISDASYFLNNMYGIVRTTIKTIDHRSFEFELISRIPGIEGLLCNKYFLWSYEQWTRGQNDYFHSYFNNGSK